jgi:hypothetical protein
MFYFSSILIILDITNWIINKLIIFLKSKFIGLLIIEEFIQLNLLNLIFNKNLIHLKLFLINKNILFIIVLLIIILIF